GPGPGLVAMGSHDLALDLLASHLRRVSSLAMTSAHVGSMGGLIALARGEAHLAGCHLLDEESGEYNVPFAKRVLAGVPAVIVTLVGRVQGLLVPKGNPKGIAGLDDLSRLGLRFINRQRGSGTRVLLDYLLRQAGLDPRRFAGYDTEVDTHIAVAAAVASGQADAGLGIFAAARAFGLDFIPVRNERYDLAVSRVVWDGEPGEALRRVLASREYVDSVRELGGYDTSETGAVVAELSG
ncbi:MAG: substrate-binding domain-containing protein, partial [Chloroflexota bacterium]|nr:substrate-binding domain-containing protein [Chloroflexota bacterium]